MNIEKTNININNDVLNLRRKEEIRISNSDIFAYPNRKYNYNVNLSGIENNFYINNGNPVTGLFKNITFYFGTFFDCALFKNVIFENCNFNNISIRWCEFKKCQFINSNIGIKDIDEYMYFNAKRYGELEELK